MTPDQLILTFANQLGSPELALLRLDPTKHSACWVDLAAVCAAVGPHFNGLCGAVGWEDRLAVCTQSIPAFLVIFDTRTWEALTIHPLEGVADPHGLVRDADRLLVASTGTNEIFEVLLEGDRIRSVAAFWRYPDTTPDHDLVHLNGLAWGAGELFATAFGHRDPAGSWRGARGRLFSVTTGKDVDAELSQPHTPLMYGGKLYVCESAAGRAIGYQRGTEGQWQRERGLHTGGYPRGLWPDGDTLLAAVSSQRRLSRSQGVRVDGDHPVAAGLLRLDPDTGAAERILDLSPFGREVYEILSIPGPALSAGIEAAVTARAHALQSSVEFLTDHITRTALAQEAAQQRERTVVGLVSIIIPAYNRADLLPETIDSILSQDYPDIELIVLDDGSTDDTLEVLARYRERLTAVRHDNMGENRTVNRGLELAHGEMICVVNSDDPLLPGAVSIAVDFLRQHPDTLAAYPDWVEIDAQGRTLKTYRLPQYDIHSMLLTLNVTIGPGVFIRRRALELIGMRNAALRYTGDLEYWFRLSLRGHLGHIPQVLATHRTHRGAASSSAKGRIMADEMVRLVDTVFASGYLPTDLCACRHRIYSTAHADAIAYCGSNRSAMLRHLMAGLSHAVRSGTREAWVALAPEAVLHARDQFRAMRFKIRFTSGVAQLAGSVARNLWRARHLLSPAAPTAIPPRFAFVSHVLPPMWSGQAMVIGRLLDAIPSATYLLIATSGARSAGPTEDRPPRVRLPAEPGERLWLRGDSLGAASVLLRVILRGWRIADQTRANGCSVTVAGTGDLIDLPATALACALTRTPLVVYLFDDYLNQWGFAPKVQRWASFMERVFIAKAAAVIVPNEALAEEIQRRHGVPCTVIRNPAVSLARPPTGPAMHYNPDALSIAYTGAIYHVNYAAFRTLIAAMGRLVGLKPQLAIYSAQDPIQLEGEGLSGPGVQLHPHVKPEEAVRIQQRADILFMGFSFDSAVPAVIRTSAPGKLGDYLASGRPILALTPPDSFLARYLTENRCGLVVDRDDPVALATALERLLYEPDLADTLVKNALARAQSEFAPQVAARTFLQVVKAAQ